MACIALYTSSLRKVVREDVPDGTIAGADGARVKFQKVLSEFLGEHHGALDQFYKPRAEISRKIGGRVVADIAETVEEAPMELGLGGDSAQGSKVGPDLPSPDAIWTLHLCSTRKKFYEPPENCVQYGT